MAPITRRNVSKKLQKPKLISNKDRNKKGTKDQHVDEREPDSSSGEDEISDIDSDLEEIASKSAIQILSKLGHVGTTTTSTSSSSTSTTSMSLSKNLQQNYQEQSTSYTPKKSVEKHTQHINDNEIQFVIDTKPFSQIGRRVGATNYTKSKLDLESSSYSSDDNIVENESNEDSDNNSDIEEFEKKESSTGSGVSSLRLKISKEISNIMQAKSDGSELASKMDPGMDFGKSYLSYDGCTSSHIQQKNSLEEILKKSQQDKLIQKSVITSDFEKKHSIPRISYNQQKKQRKKLKESKAGKGWFDMPVQEMTDELRNDLRILRMRSALDPKRFYKHNDMKTLPKFVQVGTVVDSPVDFYTTRVPNKQRKQSVVDELLADAQMRRYNKRKYMELQDRTRKKVAGKFTGKKKKKTQH